MKDYKLLTAACILILITIIGVSSQAFLGRDNLVEEVVEVLIKIGTGQDTDLSDEDKLHENMKNVEKFNK